MQNTIPHTHAAHVTGERTASTHGFFDWCTKQQPNSLFWLAAIMLVQCCVMVPVTLYVLAHTNMSFIYWTLPAVAIVMCLVTNLAALPTKITIPTFFISILIDVFVLSACFFLG